MDYDARGTETYTVVDLPRGTAGAEGGKVARPQGAGKHPIVICSHGFSANADNQAGWAEHFASWGFFAIAPTFPNSFSPDPAKNAQIIAGLVQAYASDTKADATRVGFEGHSAGGLATSIAASTAAPRAVVLFDPVDRDDLGKAALPKVCAPLLEIFAAPGSCNSSGNWKPFAKTSAGTQIAFDVVGSTHCDGENAPRGLCGPFCGGAADAGRQKTLAGYATAFLLSHLANDANATAVLAESALRSNAAITGVHVRSGPACGGIADAGADAEIMPPRDAGVTPQPDSGAGSRSDSGSGAGSGSGATPDSSAGSGEGAGCACHHAPGTSAPWAMIFLALALILRLRNAR